MTTRDPFRTGLVGLALIAALLLAAFNAEALPFIGGGETYRADITDASGLKDGDRVEVAGVKVGKVTGITLHGDHVQVAFRMEQDVPLGRDTAAAIKVGSLLGEKYLAVLPAGSGALDPDRPIPVARTTPAYDITEAFGDLSTTLDQIDTAALSTALDTLSDTFAETPQEVRESLDGLSRLSETIASRDEKLRELFAHTESVSGVLAERNEQFTTLLRDADLVLAEVKARREVIHQLLVHTAALAEQLTGLVADNRAQIGPTLQRLNEVIGVLRTNQESLERGIAGLAPFLRVFTNVIGNGPWFDAYIAGLVPARPAVDTDGGPR